MEVEGQLHAWPLHPPRKTSLVPIDNEAGWAPEPVCSLTEQNVCQSCQESNLDSSTFHPLALPTPLFRLHLFSATCKAYFVCRRHSFVKQL